MMHFSIAQLLNDGLSVNSGRDLRMQRGRDLGLFLPTLSFF